MKQAMIAAARRVVVLADTSKFTSPSFCTICEVTEIDEIITDERIDAAHLAALRTLGVDVQVVKVAANPRAAHG
jgi:DeoR family transcriptional regulator of aga operon